MTITTKEFTLTRRDYFHILVRDSLRRSLVVYGLLYACAVPLLSVRSSTTSKVFGVLCLLYPLLIMALLWRCSGATSIPRWSFRPKYYEITDEFLTAHFNDGTLSKVRFDDVTKVIATPRYYLLYFGRQVVFLPATAFFSEEDKIAFAAMLKARRLISPDRYVAKAL